MLLQLEQFLHRKPRSRGFERGTALAQAIVDTVREPLVVLDRHLRVVTASRSFYATFRVTREETQWRPFYELGDGQWDIPALRHLLGEIVPKHTIMADYAVEHDFPAIGRRIMLLNAGTVFDENNECSHLLLAIEDITERRDAERKIHHLLEQKDLLLAEMQHRISNSLQIIASILRLKAGNVDSEEIRNHLLDAHTRVLSVAAVQKHLIASDWGEQVVVAPYLSKLCETLGQSMIGGSGLASLAVVNASGTLSSSDAVSIGLIVTESVINAFKHAFTLGRKDGQIIVAYEPDGSAWKLSIADNGRGKATSDLSHAKTGLGTRIVNALAQQLDAQVDIVSGESGTTVCITHYDPTVASQGVNGVGAKRTAGDSTDRLLEKAKVSTDLGVAS